MSAKDLFGDRRRHARSTYRWLIVGLAAVALGSCARGLTGSLADLGVTPVPPQPREAPELQLPGLIALGSGDAIARLHWRAPGPDYEVLLFHAATRNAVFATPPTVAVAGTTSHTFRGLSNDVTGFFGMALRRPGTTAATPVGEILSARPGAPIYIDATAHAGSADGRTPATAFADLASALLAAGSAPANLWLGPGDYPVAALLVPAGTSIYGGFAADFELDTRRPADSLSILRVAGLAGLSLHADGEPLRLDGLVFDGSDGLGVGLDLDGVSAELRSVQVRDCSDHGMRVQNSSQLNSRDLLVCGCTWADNGGDGISLAGAFDVRIFGSSWQRNGQEGIDCDDLIALEQETASLRVSACFFANNAAEGLDADLSAPLSPGAPSGRFSVTLRACRFVDNGFHGLTLDQDYETAPLWTARISVTECSFLGNQGAGIHLDADGPGEVLLHRLLISANQEDGILVSSELAAGNIAVTDSILVSNRGAGIRASVGQKTLLAGQCIFAGNAGGGLISEVVEAAATSCISYLQAEPYRLTRQIHNVTASSPDDQVFENVADGYFTISQRQDRLLTIQATRTVPVGALIEVLDNGLTATVVSTDGNTLSLARGLPEFILPTVASQFPAGGSAQEDYQLSTDSLASGRGLSRDPGSPRDGGAFAGGDWTPGRPGPVALPSYFVSQTLPPLNQTIAQDGRLIIAFSGAIDPSTAKDHVLARDGSGTLIPLTVLAFGDQMHLLPATGSWGTTPFTVELHTGIASASGIRLTTPMALPLTPQL